MLITMKDTGKTHVDGKILVLVATKNWERIYSELYGIQKAYAAQ